MNLTELLRDHLPILGIGIALVVFGVLYLLQSAIVAFRQGRSGRALMRGTGTLFGLLFSGFTYWMFQLPILRGSQWTLIDMAVRIAAIIFGVLFIIALMSGLLPLFLDRLEGRTFSSFVAARHVRSQKSGFLTIISVLSICGVAISSCSLSSVVSVMGGFSHDLKEKILGNNAHIIVDQESLAPWENYEDVLAKIEAIPGVIAAMPVAQGEVMVSSNSNLAGVVVRGVDVERLGHVINLSKTIEVGKLDYLTDPDRLRRLPPDEVIGLGANGEHYLKGPDGLDLPSNLDPQVREAVEMKPLRPSVIIGRELAKTLHVYVGDEITLVSPMGELGPMGVMPRTKKVRVAAIFFSGHYEFDASQVYALLPEVQSYFGFGEKATAIDIKVEDGEKVEPVTDLVRAAVLADRPELRVRDWRELNRSLFSALKLERIATFIILSLAILVASFCIICTLLLMVSEKGKEIAILKALGASDRSILRTFIYEGLMIGGVGIIYGMSIALALCTGLKWFGVRLKPDVYYIDKLPINVDALDFLAVAAAAVVICGLSTIYPALAASRLRPVDGLRHE